MQAAREGITYRDPYGHEWLVCGGQNVARLRGLWCAQVPTLWEQSGPAYPLFSAYAFAAAVIMLCLTSSTDPGYILRHKQPPPTAPQTTASASVQRKTTIVETNIGRETFTWCRSCELWRPPKSHHCSDCGHCVLGFDHHCPFVNNCVGVRNHGYFMGFLGRCSASPIRC